MQRMLYQSTRSTSRFTPVNYVNTTGLSFAWDADDSLDFGIVSNNINPLFIAALLPISPNQGDGQDPYNYPLIPSIPVLPSDNVTADGNGLYSDLEFSNVVKYTDFVSLYGIPFGNTVNGTSTYQYNMTSSYFTFNCPFLKEATMDEILATGVNLKRSPSETLFMSITGPSTGVQGTLTFAAMLSNDTSWNETFSYSQCTFSQTYVDSQVICDGDTLCQVSAISYSTNHSNTPTPMSNEFDQAFLNASSLNNLDNSSTTATEYWLIDPENISGEYEDYPNIYGNVSLADFETRLALLINTYWGIGYAPMFQTGGLPLFDDESDIHAVITPALYIETTPRFAASWGWVVVLFFCSAVLLVAGVATAIWEHQTIAPDILGFASSIVRHSKYVNFPKGDSTTTGPERARLLADVHVMMQDVRPNADVGRIVLGTVSEKAQRLQQGRLYH